MWLTQRTIEGKVNSLEFFISSINSNVCLSIISTWGNSDVTENIATWQWKKWYNSVSTFGLVFISFGLKKKKVYIWRRLRESLGKTGVSQIGSGYLIVFWIKVFTRWRLYPLPTKRLWSLSQPEKDNQECLAEHFQMI